MSGDGIQHVLLTRVNVSRGFGHTDGRAATPEWLDRQLALFEGLALPAIRAQSTSDFTWVLMASEDTPDEYRRRIASYADDRTVVHFVGDYSENLPGELVSQHLDRSADRLLTSRIDTDDVVSREYMQRVRHAAADHAPCFLNWDHGYLFDLDRGRLYSHEHGSNMFINMIEELAVGTSIATTAGVIHTRAAETLPVVHVQGDRAWIQVIHDQNWMTDLGEPRRVNRRALQRFSAPLLDASPDSGFGDVVVDRARWEARRVSRRTARMLRR